MPTLTFDESGAALTETEDGITMPADYSFTTVNGYVHGIHVDFEDLVCLCLGMANHIDKLTHRNKMNKSKNDYTKKIKQLERRISDCETALKVIYTWAGFDGALVPDHVRELIAKTIKIGRTSPED